MRNCLVIDLDRCSGCDGCVAACKLENNVDLGVCYNRVHAVGPTGTFPDIEQYWIPLQCQQCENPGCIEVCPTGASYRDEETGIVWTDHDVCIGCKTCETACPYGAPTFGEEEGYMLKCDMCKDEIARDRLPICVAGCPMRALDFGTREEMIEKYGEGDVEVEPLPADTTDPNLILTPHRNAQKSGSGTGSVVNLEEEL